MNIYPHYITRKYSVLSPFNFAPFPLMNNSTYNFIYKVQWVKSKQHKRTLTLFAYRMCWTNQTVAITLLTNKETMLNELQDCGFYCGFGLHRWFIVSVNIYRTAKLLYSLRHITQWCQTIFICPLCQYHNAWRVGGLWQRLARWRLLNRV